jgi:molecular chaperone DnaK
MKLGQAIYESQQGAAGGDAGAAAGAGAETAEAGTSADEEEVVDAEFSEVDDEKKA